MPVEFPGGMVKMQLTALEDMHSWSIYRVAALLKTSLS